MIISQSTLSSRLECFNLTGNGYVILRLPHSLKTALRAQNYIASDEIATVLYLSQALGKPVLTEGPAGVGKTELAKAWPVQPVIL